ncbi:MAG TPA: hypothetical protein VH079_04895 [Terriglobales bacterium]|jgi:hypothetical protein|nr:hypothetical protein [Terriglobales bacterium]
MPDKVAISAEIAALAKLQIKAVKDATFFGWDTVESAAYDDRRRKLRTLHAELEAIASGEI